MISTPRRTELSQQSPHRCPPQCSLTGDLLHLPRSMANSPAYTKYARARLTSAWTGWELIMYLVTCVQNAEIPVLVGHVRWGILVPAYAVGCLSGDFQLVHCSRQVGRYLRRGRYPSNLGMLAPAPSTASREEEEEKARSPASATGSDRFKQSRYSNPTLLATGHTWIMSLSQSRWRQVNINIQNTYPVLVLGFLTYIHSSTQALYPDTSHSTFRSTKPLLELRDLGFIYHGAKSFPRAVAAPRHRALGRVRGNVLVPVDGTVCGPGCQLRHLSC